MTRENWALTRAGLERIRQAPRPGLHALLTLANVNISALGERDVTYVIAPRLNAAARLGEPLVAIELLLATSDSEASTLAARLDSLNQERQRVTEEMMVDAQRQAESQVAGSSVAGPLVSAVGEGWPLGMLGLVASRLAEHYQRAAVVISNDGAEARGSARAPDGMNLGEALAARLRSFVASGAMRAQLVSRSPAPMSPCCSITCASDSPSSGRSAMGRSQAAQAAPTPSRSIAACR